MIESQEKMKKKSENFVNSVKMPKFATCFVRKHIS